MKTRFVPHVLAAVTVAVAGVFDFQNQAQADQITSVTTSQSLPDEIQPGTPTAQVIKLVQSGVDTNVVQTYINDSRSAFNLDADKIIALSDAGVPGYMVNSMIAHDKNFLASLPTAEQPAPVSNEPPPAPVSDTNAVAAAGVDMAAPTEPVTVNDFYNTLSPYGSWVNVDGYGLCWRPTVVVYNSTWRPYCDRGTWVYTDCGWYWNSDYAWGVTFHYGRWFNSPRYGWCWWPDTVWAPSWVTWRSSTDYCGWAPLPPFSIYQPGIGFTYRGKNVALSFGFGLASSCFTFVSSSHFCEPHPRYYCVPQHDIARIYSQTAVCNNYGWHDRRIINNGVSVTVIGTAAHHPIQPVSIGSLVNVNRHGWHGQSYHHSEHHFGASNSNGAQTHDFAENSYRRDTVDHNEFEGHHGQTFNVTSGQVANHRDNNVNHGQISITRDSSNHQQHYQQGQSLILTGNQNHQAYSWQQSAAANNYNRNNQPNSGNHTASQHNQGNNNWAANNTGQRQLGSAYTGSLNRNQTTTTTTTTQTHSFGSNNGGQNRIVQSRQESHQFAAERNRQSSPVTAQPRQNISRQSFVQASPRHTAPAVHNQNSAPQNNGNAAKNWMAKNR